MRIDWHPEQVTAEIEKRAMDNLEKAGEMVAQRARELVPVRTGNLKESIRVTRLSGDPHLDIRVYAGSREKGGAWYAHIVERGSVRTKKHPFLRPALNAVKGRLIDIVAGK